MTPRVHTFSIVAHDPQDQAWGVAVASKFLAAAAVVSWARAGVGAIATQALARVGYGPGGLALMEQGLSASDTLAALLADDPGHAARQVALVDAHGGVAAYTGPECSAYAGHITGERFSVQGNILAGPGVLDAMAAAYRNATGPLAERLLAALRAADDAGGDRRGRQAAGVLVVRPGGGYGGDNDRYLDLRADDDPAPLDALARMIAAHHVFFGTPREDDRVPISPDIARELQALCRAQGVSERTPDGVWDDAARAAFWALVGAENLEERWSPATTPDAIDRVALGYLRARFGG